jgi:hypothetical protein
VDDGDVTPVPEGIRPQPIPSPLDGQPSWSDSLPQSGDGFVETRWSHAEGERVVQCRSAPAKR